MFLSVRRESKVYNFEQWERKKTEHEGLHPLQAAAILAVPPIETQRISKNMKKVSADLSSAQRINIWLYTYTHSIGNFV